MGYGLLQLGQDGRVLCLQECDQHQLEGVGAEWYKVVCVDVPMDHQVFERHQDRSKPWFD